MFFYNPRQDLQNDSKGPTQDASLGEKQDTQNTEKATNKIVESTMAESTRITENGAGQSTRPSMESSEQKEQGNGNLNHDDEGTATIASHEAATFAGGDKNLQLDLAASSPPPSAPITTQVSNASSNECSSPVDNTPVAATPGHDHSASLLLPGNNLLSANLVNHHTTSQPPSPHQYPCLLYTSPSPRDATLSRMPSSA